MDIFNMKDDCCLEGVKCDVQNCSYNNHKKGCTATEIKVGPTSASSATDTACTSYKQQQW